MNFREHFFGVEPCETRASTPELLALADASTYLCLWYRDVAGKCKDPLNFLYGYRTYHCQGVMHYSKRNGGNLSILSVNCNSNRLIPLYLWRNSDAWGKYWAVTRQVPISVTFASKKEKYLFSWLVCPWCISYSTGISAVNNITGVLIKLFLIDKAVHTKEA